MSKITDLAEVYLNKLENLNDYSSSNKYDLENDSSLLSNLIDITNTLVGNSNLPNTPIQQIANVQLNKAIALNISNNLRTIILPAVTVINGKVGLTDINYWNISANDNPSSFSSIVDILTGYVPPINPIPYISSNFTSQNSNDYLKSNRGQGQIDSYNSNISLNDYTEDSPYGSINNINDSNSLLAKTNSIIQQNSLINGYPSLVSKIGDNISIDALAYNDISLSGNTGKLISKGDGTKVNDSSTQFLRVFNYSKKYQSASDLMKFNYSNPNVNSVLQTVFPNISPNLTDINKTKDVRNLMFSIENLAFTNSKINLKPYEVGPNGGRLMWFPPYDLKFDESTSSEFETVKFLGRVEPIYTFNGGERTITFSFKLIVDYSSNFWDNSWNSASNNDFNKFHRQDNQISKTLSIGDASTQQVQKVLTQVPTPQPTVANNYSNDFPFSNRLTIHFDDASYTMNQSLTEDNSNGDGQKDNDNFYKNISNLITFLNTDDGSKFQISIDGFSSTLNIPIGNNKLSVLRAKSVYDYIVSQITNIDSNSKLNENDLASATKTKYSNKKFILTGNGSNLASNQNSTQSTISQDVVDRKVDLYINYNAALDTSISTPVQDNTAAKTNLNNQHSQQATITNNNVKGGEQIYFERIKATDKLLFDKLSDELKYFSPVFHSQTPEDMNARLTFLEQCTKQGNSPAGVQNSIFGLPPVSVLRIGDFFHTKIIITSINKSYTPLVWDMNPEGIGMQPMICDVTMDCKVIGGQSLEGPITKLQNALDYNFYANSQDYKLKGK